MLRYCVSLLVAATVFAAEPADWVITGRYVVTMNPRREVIEDGAVAVNGTAIAAVGKRAEIDRRFDARKRLNRPDALIAPGLINTHTHAAMSLFRGIADDLRLQDWLEKYIFPAEAKNVSSEFVRWGTKLACLEMMLSGTTTFADMYYFEEAAAEATVECGLRGVLGQTIIGFPSPDAKTPAAALKRAEAFLRRYRNDSLVVPAIAPHALYTNSGATLKASRELANRYGVPLLIHLSETRTENEESRVKHGATPTQVLNRLGVFNGRTVAAHCVWLDEQDRRLLKERNAGIAHCASSNMKLASGVAPVVDLLDLGIATGLGTDGPAGSNNDFDLFEEMDLASKLQKVTTGDPRALPAAQAFAMATITGARALGMEHEIGSLEAGKRADLITVSLNRPNAIPLYSVFSHLVYALKGSDVSDVMVNGKLLVEQRRAKQLDAEEILRRGASFGLRISRSIGK
ncbi:MAG: amidohydrolase family protein [Bryobacteraceae bacterium]|nr:amidohydrolase family protein [Bryobacterales bacterium]NUN02004.1 amidohydrolase family protein [Bryobacteraceae bacterium]